MGKWVFARFEFKMRFELVSYIAYAPDLYQAGLNMQFISVWEWETYMFFFSNDEVPFSTHAVLSVLRIVIVFS